MVYINLEICIVDSRFGFLAISLRNNYTHARRRGSARFLPVPIRAPRRPTPRGSGASRRCAGGGEPCEEPRGPADPGSLRSGAPPSTHGSTASSSSSAAARYMHCIRSGRILAPPLPCDAIFDYSLILLVNFDVLRDGLVTGDIDAC